MQRKVDFVPASGRHFVSTPAELLTAILEGIKQQMLEDGQISELELHSAGPVAEEPDMPSGEWEDFWDDVKGGYLDPTLVREARQEEIGWVRKSDMFDIRPRSESFQETGKKPIDLRWVNTNKGDATHPLIRCRLVIRDVKARKKEADKLPAQDLFSSMPPLEALRVLISLMLSLKVSSRGKPLKLAIFDISRAHF